MAGENGILMVVSGFRHHPARLQARIALDGIMTLLLIALMGRMITGDRAHEIIGSTMIVLWILHGILNRKWYAALLRGRYSATRIITVTINILLVASAIGVAASGVVLSSYAFRFLGIKTGISVARAVHMVCSYWCFILSSAHLGLHWGAISKAMRNDARISQSGSASTIAFRLVVVLISVLGAYAFIKQRLVSYLFAKTLFAFFDFGQSFFLFFFQYWCIMVLFAVLSFNLSGQAGRRPCKEG